MENPGPPRSVFLSLQDAYGRSGELRHDLARERREVQRHQGLAALRVRFSERPSEAGIEPSAGSVGDSDDNALVETINGLFKAEAIHRRGPWRSFEAVEYATPEWIDWFNTRRLLEPIGNIPPAEAKEEFCAALEAEAVAAQPTKISLRQRQRQRQRASEPQQD